MKLPIIPLMTAGLSLSACETTGTDRALSRAVGGTTEALTDKDTIDLGKPIWRR